MLDFLVNYWLLILVLFIIFLILILFILTYKENKFNENIDEKNTNGSNDLISNSTIEAEDEINYVDQATEERETLLNDIDHEFEQIIPKKEVIDDSLMESVESLKIEPIKIEPNDTVDTNINLPEIKIEKSLKNEDIWKK